MNTPTPEEEKRQEALRLLAALSQSLRLYEKDEDEPGHDPFFIFQYKLVPTCFACPEQYDVFEGDEQMGYLRLRHGDFTAEYPDCGGTLVFEACPEGDGRFMKAERMAYLHLAVEALEKEHRRVLQQRNNQPSYGSGQ